MLQLIHRIEKKQIVWLVNALVFLFFTTVLAFPKGYSFAPMVLAGIGIIYLFIYLVKYKKKLTPTKEDKWLIFAFVFYFATFLFLTLIHHDKLREIDNPSKILFFLPLLLLFKQFTINLKVILHGIPIGASVAGIIAIYQKFYLGAERAFSDIISIQAGDIAVSLSAFSLIIAIYWTKQNAYKLTILCIIGGLLGIIASTLSGTRGGWISIPFLFIITLYFYRNELSKRVIYSCTILFTAIIITIINIPQLDIIKRYKAAEDNIIQYIKRDTKTTSIGARLDMWQNALLGIKEKPILGWGSQGYLDLKKQQVKQKTMNKKTVLYNDAHNQYLDSLIKRGMLGLLALIAIIFIPLKVFLNRIKEPDILIRTISLLGIIHIIAILLYCLSQTFFAHNSGSIFYFFIIIILYEALSKSSSDHQKLT
ncbi:hypothetical protein A6B43_03000 [Vespertiliibacter pulmonis]|uniref:O-antigen ligase n=1 Tax=Vespertiliibacter pulmonis TaxID=1443036 RepID=A0A3N4VIQ5_9PAST|nr:O-antigen ligase family protein [Vespertiliibacter pulmonis]QLB20567.1 hypothetical protein A6B43_03000 [Vespertiliibacter pulmonis]RPE82698.1 O-antigen ligase [Vespertiliibacter pulmonis]